MRVHRFALLGLLLVAGCDQHATKTETAVTSTPEVAPLPAQAPAKVDATYHIIGWEPPTSADTLLTLNGHPYYLRLQSEMDSTKRLTVMYESEPGRHEKAQGYEGRFTFTLRDSLKRLVFRRQLHKADFFKKAGAEIVVQSSLAYPLLLGYSAPLGALIFTIGFGVPDTDWGSEVVLLMDLKGNVLRMSDGYNYGGGAESTPELSKDGYTLLTASEIVRAHQPAISLNKPNAELRGAFFLNDTALVTIYKRGNWRKNSKGEEEFIATVAQKKALNSFVLHTRTGKILSQFHYSGYVEELGYTVPRYYVHNTHALYLLDENKGLTLLLQQAPDKPSTLAFSGMSEFVAPQRATEIRFEKQGNIKNYAFYVDTINPNRVRYQILYDGENNFKPKD